MSASKLTRNFQAALSADEVEHACIAGARASAEAGLLDERISGEVDDAAANGALTRSQGITFELDERAGAYAEELERRCNLPGNGYPFAFEGRSLQYRGSKTFAYEFCLAVSRAETLTTGDFVRLPRNFERLAAVSARLYLGDGADCVRLGSPTDSEDPAGHPRDFLGRANHLASASPAGWGEWHLLPKAGFEEKLDNANDYGMDFVAWKAFPDGRIGRLTLLGQCACGKNDQTNETKLKELDIQKIRNLFSTLTWLEPIRSFATPFHAPDREQFIEMHQMGGVIFDRARIASVCEANAHDPQLVALRPRFEELIRLSLGRVMPQRVGAGAHVSARRSRRA